MRAQLEFTAYPARRYAQAPSAERARALLFMTGNEEPLRLLERHDRRIHHRAAVTSCGWSGGRLRIDLAIGLFENRTVGRRRPVVFRVSDDQIQRVLSDKIVRSISEGAVSSFPATIDVTDELPRTDTFLVLRRNGANDTIRIGATTQLDTRTPVDDDGLFTPAFTATLEIDAYQAHLLADRRWERYTVVDAFGLRTIRPFPVFSRSAVQAPGRDGADEDGVDEDGVDQLAGTEALTQ